MKDMKRKSRVRDAQNPATEISTPAQPRTGSYTSLRINVAVPQAADGGGYYSTYVFFREYRPPGTTADAGGGGRTLIVCNVPSLPVYDLGDEAADGRMPRAMVSKTAALRAIFGRFGAVADVATATSADADGGIGDGDGTLTDPHWYLRCGDGGCGRDLDERFGRVTFDSPKTLRKAVASIASVTSAGGDVPRYDSSKKEEAEPPGVTIGQLELLSLLGGDGDQEAADDDGSDEELAGAAAAGVAGLARRYRAWGVPSREALRTWSNGVMARYEEGESAAAEAAAGGGAAGEEDEDGFVTVGRTAGTATGAARRALEEEGGGRGGVDGGRRRGGIGRSRKKRKRASGAAELADFYRFQVKDVRNSEVNDLRAKFEEDKARLAEMKSRSS